jgi:hypothetical protein
MLVVLPLHLVIQHLPNHPREVRVPSRASPAPCIAFRTPVSMCPVITLWHPLLLAMSYSQAWVCSSINCSVLAPPDLQEIDTPAGGWCGTPCARHVGTSEPSKQLISDLSHPFHLLSPSPSDHPLSDFSNTLHNSSFSVALFFYQKFQTNPQTSRSHIFQKVMLGGDESTMPILFKMSQSLIATQVWNRDCKRLGWKRIWGDWVILVFSPNPLGKMLRKNYQITYAKQHREVSTVPFFVPLFLSQGLGELCLTF